jgi:hypothetical protein
VFPKRSADFSNRVVSIAHALLAIALAAPALDWAQPRRGVSPAIFFQTAWTEAWSSGASEHQRLSHDATSSTLRETAGPALGPQAQRRGWP